METRTRSTSFRIRFISLGQMIKEISDKGNITQIKIKIIFFRISPSLVDEPSTLASLGEEAAKESGNGRPFSNFTCERLADSIIREATTITARKIVKAFR